MRRSKSRRDAVGALLDGRTTSSSLRRGRLRSACATLSKWLETRPVLGWSAAQAMKSPRRITKNAAAVGN